MGYKDYTNEYIEIFEALKKRYPTSMNPDISSVLFCQDEEDVWIEMTYEEKTSIGVKVKKETLNLDFLTYDEDPSDNYYDLADYIEDNAEKFIRDGDTLFHTTPILVNANDLPSPLEGCFKLEQIRCYVREVFDFLIQRESQNAERYTNVKTYVLSALEAFEHGDPLSKFDITLEYVAANNKKWLSVWGEDEMLSAQNVVYVYTPGIGGDTYTEWEFAMYGTGEIDGDLHLHSIEALDMICAGAKVKIVWPLDDDKEEEEE